MSRMPAMLLLLLISLPSVVRGLDDWVELTASCGNGATAPNLTATMLVTSELTASWVGWVVDRTTIGACEPAVQVNGPHAFPATLTSVAFSDPTVVPGRAYQYRIRAVDAAGNRFYLGWGGGDFPPAFYETAYVTCGNAVAVRGNLVRSGGRIDIVPCADQCWLPILLLAFLPAELETYIDTVEVVELRGTLADEFEGPYLDGITGWSTPGVCGNVATVPVSWGAVKSTYR